ncbi:hypothetical protein C8R43DRAFT_424118 [Mycena crocata]|nr:hypothetical protein C8R43DRAFT_424118 [Mycena crocata]
MSAEYQPLLPSTTQTSSHSRRERAAEFLETPLLHKFVIFLITVGGFQSRISSSSLTHRDIDASCVLADLGYTFLHEECTPPAGPDAPVWLSVLSHISLGITALFLVEIPVTLWALGTRFYNPFGGVPHAALHLFDAFIIVVTFVLEVVLKGREQELVGLLITLRLWRLVKLVGGVSVGVGEIGEEDAIRATEAERQLAELKRENADLRAKLEAAGLLH